MSNIELKQAPVFGVIHPNGTFKRSRLDVLMSLPRGQHVVEIRYGDHRMEMHHSDTRKQGGTLNEAASTLLAQEGLVQVKGQKRKCVYGDAVLVSRQAYPYFRIDKSAIDLLLEVDSAFPNTQTLICALPNAVSDLYITEDNPSDELLFKAKLTFG